MPSVSHITFQLLSRSHGIMPPPRLFLPAAKTEFTERTIHNCLVAMIGGFLARKGDGEPGVKTMWLGLQRVVDFAAGIRFARESHAL
jgi:hypothetical protein